MHRPVINQLLVERLHLAHADYLQEYALAMPDGPIRAFFIAPRTMRNRITLTGNEDMDALDPIVEWFSEQGAEDCHVELNPSNHIGGSAGIYPPELIAHLIDRRFEPRGFRTVWACQPEVSEPDCPNNVKIQRFERDDLEAFIAELNIVDEIDKGERARERDEEVRNCENVSSWVHYIAYVDDVPRANASLFVTGKTGYLAWGFTNREARKQGLHGHLIAQRVNDAAERGCDIAFSVTNFSNQSSFNLQRMGFELAYNYLRWTKTLR